MISGHGDNAILVLFVAVLTGVGGGVLRDIFINEDAKIDNCVKSVGIISNKTIIARHPWVTDLEHELAQIEEDKQAELDEMDATMKIQQKNEPTGNSFNKGVAK